MEDCGVVRMTRWEPLYLDNPALTYEQRAQRAAGLWVTVVEDVQKLAMHDALNIPVALKKAAEGGVTIKPCPRPSIKFEIRAFCIICGLAGGDSAKSPIAANIFPRNVQAFYRFESILIPQQPHWVIVDNCVQPH